MINLTSLIGSCAYELLMSFRMTDKRPKKGCEEISSHSFLGLFICQSDAIKKK